jgi:hypothetical protein
VPYARPMPASDIPREVGAEESGYEVAPLAASASRYSLSAASNRCRASATHSSAIFHDAKAGVSREALEGFRLHRSRDLHSNSCPISLHSKLVDSGHARYCGAQKVLRQGSPWGWPSGVRQPGWRASLCELRGRLVLRREDRSGQAVYWPRERPAEAYVIVEFEPRRPSKGEKRSANLKTRDDRIP